MITINLSNYALHSPSAETIAIWVDERLQVICR
jgi:hypothetical protein